MWIFFRKTFRWFRSFSSVPVFFKDYWIFEHFSFYSTYFSCNVDYFIQMNLIFILYHLFKQIHNSFVEVFIMAVVCSHALYAIHWRKYQIWESGKLLVFVPAEKPLENETMPLYLFMTSWQRRKSDCLLFIRNFLLRHSRHAAYRCWCWCQKLARRVLLADITAFMNQFVYSFVGVLLLLRLRHNNLTLLKLLINLWDDTKCTMRCVPKMLVCIFSRSILSSIYVSYRLNIRFQHQHTTWISCWILNSAFDISFDWFFFLRLDHSFSQWHSNSIAAECFERSTFICLEMNWNHIQMLSTIKLNSVSRKEVYATYEETE